MPPLKRRVGACVSLYHVRITYAGFNLQILRQPQFQRKCYRSRRRSSLEGKRERLLADTDGKTFAELTENAPEEFREKLSAQHEELRA